MAGRALADLSIDNQQDGLFRVNRQTFTDSDRFIWVVAIAKCCGTICLAACARELA
jgi:hypothetical protein